MSSTPGISIRTARLSDALAIEGITSLYAEKGYMLKRAPENIIENIRNFFVAEKDGSVIGTCAISFFTLRLAEIRTLAVLDSFMRCGVGSMLVRQAEEVLREEGVTTVFVLTLSPDFFLSMGYREVKKEMFPQKIWRDCTNCPKLMACDEIAMIKELDRPESRTSE
ncbi:MAG: N-acetyltransferase [Chlorobium phaeobacteroides]|uniref:GCN5-related N-acetyltransferase n=1 Tax=Chlorobium phaeobacteroides (strain BS1) TaxID=331678 RepID=B3EP73_CHLPB|nr:N-acetyltransferase [Chlorobium phaeobacteroides]MBL6955739.1 N-acetyltransferase [Chlorobium phaeobacteroides]